MLRRRFAALLAALIVGTGLAVATAPAAQGYSGSLWNVANDCSSPWGIWMTMGYGNWGASVPPCWWSSDAANRPYEDNTVNNIYLGPLSCIRVYRPVNGKWAYYKREINASPTNGRWVSLSAERYPHGAYLAQGRNYIAFDSCAQYSTSG